MRECFLIIQLRSCFGAGVYLCLGWENWYPEALEEKGLVMRMGEWDQS